MTLIQQLDAGGAIPTWLDDKKMPVALSAVQEAIDDLRQDEKIDNADRADLLRLMKGAWRAEKYSKEEIALLQRVRQKFEGSLKDGKWKSLKSPDVFVSMESIYEEGSTSGIGRAVTIVDASIEDCAAWEYVRVTRGRLRSHRKNGGLEKSVVKLNNHCDLYHNAVDFGIKTFAPREWLSKVVWKMMEEDTMIVCFEDTEHDDFPLGAGKDYVRASSGSFWKYERLPEVRDIPQTRVIYVQQADLKGFIPTFLINAKIVGMLMYLR